MRFCQASRMIQAAFTGCNLTLIYVTQALFDLLLLSTGTIRSRQHLPTMAGSIDNNAIGAPVIAIDLGDKRVGVAVSDALSISITRLEAIPRTNWKQLLRDIDNLIHRFDAQTVVIGLPLRLNGSVGDSAVEARRVAEKFARSLKVPVYLQDERLSSVEAEENLRLEGHERERISSQVDSEAAAIVLRDFLAGDQARILVPGS
jgi:putative Holliday junction resolvase